MAIITTEIVKKLLKEGKKVSEIARQFNVSRQAVYRHINKIKKKEKGSNLGIFKPKKNYNSMIDWKIYNEGLVKRGEILLDFDLFKDWHEELAKMNEGKAGRPYKYPESFIQFLMRLKFIFKIDYRSLEGVARKLVSFIPHCTKAPDYSTLQVRFSKMKCNLEVYQKEGEQEIAVDATGLKTSNRGEYRMNAYRGKRKKFIKLHIAVNIKTRQVVGCSVTPEDVRDHEELLNIVSQAQKYGKATKIFLDPAYDTNDIHMQLKENGIKPVIKPRETMELRRVNQVIEEENKRIKMIKDKNKKKEIQKRLIRLNTLKEYLEDRQKWKKENEYGERWKAEGRYSVFKRIFGEHVLSKKIRNMHNEAILKVNLMNLFTYLTIRAMVSDGNVT